MGKLYVRDDNMCSEDHAISVHSNGAGSGCMFLSSLMAFASSTSDGM